MGLEEFADEDNESSNKSSSGLPSGNLDTGNSPGYAKQCFNNDSRCSPRAIKYEIESVADWVKQFSTRRIDEGELVMYASMPELEENGVTIAVFTTILSSFNRPNIEEQHPIWVVKWGMEENKPLDSGREIHREGSDEKIKDNWEEQLNEVLSNYLID